MIPACAPRLSFSGTASAAVCSPRATNRLHGATALSRTLFVIMMVLIARVAHAQPGPTAPVRVPITVDYMALTAALRQELYTDQGRAPLWNGTDQCQYLYAENPLFSRGGNRIKLETHATLSLGIAVGSQCLSPISWSGIVEAAAVPYVAPKMVLKLRVTDLNLYNDQHEKTFIVGRGFDLIKQYFVPRIETFTFDLSPATGQLENLAVAAAPPEVAERVKRALATLRAEPELAAGDDGVRAVVELDVPVFATPGAIPPRAQLTPEELAALDKQLSQWDGFLVFAVKQLGERDPKTRDDLLDLLLDSRRRLVEALGKPEAGGADPVRILFLNVWGRLAEIVRGAAHRGTLGDQSLEFLSFVSAGDALFALDQAAPALGMKISAEDLRRLAHIIAPHVTADPLAFSFAEDPELKKMFGVMEPLSSEGPLEMSPTEIPTVVPPSAAVPSVSSGPAIPTPSTAAPPTSPGAAPSPRAVPISTLRSGLRLLSANPAYGAEALSATSEIAAKLRQVAKRLKRAVVENNNAESYRASMAHLLKLCAQREAEDEEVDPSHRAVYLKLAPATAWQESCWRQFVLKGNRVVFLESASHDVGLMQVNKYVWRGFYSIPRLEWDVLYNASAGMGILARLLKDVARRHDAANLGNPDELARSVYAAYNGGPGAYRRWRMRESREKRYIDEAFWAKYQAVARGQDIDILKCSAEWNH